MVKGSGVYVTGPLMTSVAGDDFTIAPSTPPRGQRLEPAPPLQAATAPGKYLVRTRHCDTQPVQTTW